MWDRVIFWFTHVHEWECQKPDPSWDKESYWYWHDEVCWCSKKRHVLNHGGDNVHTS